MSIADVMAAPFAVRIADEVMPPKTAEDLARDPRVLDKAERRGIERKEGLGNLAIGLGLLAGLGIVFAVTAKAPVRSKPASRFRGSHSPAPQPILVEAVS